MRKLGLILGGALLGLYVLYVATMFVFLRSGTLESKSEKWESASVSVESGYSLWPGVIHLRGMDVRFLDYNIEVQLVGKEVTARVAIFDLFQRTVRVRSIKVKGGAYRMLHRVKDAKKNRARLAAFPSILPRPDVYDAPRKPRPKDPFEIVVDSIDAEVEELWILEYRAVGKFQATGGFEIRDEVRVKPSKGTARAHTVFVGEREVLKDVKCKVSSEIGPFPRVKAKPEEILQHLAAGLLCDMGVSRIYFVDVYFPESAFALAGRGSLHLDLTVKSGQVLDSKMLLTLPEMSVVFKKEKLAGALKMALGVDGKGDADLDVKYQGARLKARRSAVFLKKLTAKVGLAQKRLDQLVLERASASLEGLTVSDPKFFRNVIGSESVPVFDVTNLNASGSVTLKENQLKQARLWGSSAFTLHPAKDLALGCALSVQAACERKGEKISCQEAKVGCINAALVDGEKSATGLSYHLNASPLSLTTEGDVDTVVTLRGDSPKPIAKRVIGDKVMAKIGVALLPLGDLFVRAHINRAVKEGTTPTIAGNVTEFRSGALHGTGTFVLATGLESRWQVQSPIGRFGISQDASGVKVKALVKKNWLEQGK